MSQQEMNLGGINRDEPNPSYAEYEGIPRYHGYSTNYEPVQIFLFVALSLFFLATIVVNIWFNRRL